MKTLQIIQTLFNVGRILCKIFFILCLIGGIGCALGIVSLALIPEGIKIGDTTIRGLIEQSADVSLGTCYAAMATGIVLCAGEAVLCRIAEDCFAYEVEVKTPFAFEVARKLMRLGICTICIPIGTGIVAAIVHGIFAAAMENVAAQDLSAFGSGSVGLGIMFLITGLLCRYGAEKTAPDRTDEES